VVVALILPIGPRILLEEMIVIQVFNKFPVFMEAEDTLECSQDPATEPCPEPVKANVHGCIQKFPD
jgi:hypothetical protein